MDNTNMRVMKLYCEWANCGLSCLMLGSHNWVTWYRWPYSMVTLTAQRDLSEELVG